MTASQWEGPEHEEKTVRWESKSEEQRAAQVLATMWVSLEEIHVSWTGPFPSTFEMTLHVLWEPPREA